LTKKLNRASQANTICQVDRSRKT